MSHRHCGDGDPLGENKMHDVLVFASASFGKLLVAAIGLSIPIGFFYGCYRLVKARPILGTLILTTTAVIIVYAIARYA